MQLSYFLSSISLSVYGLCVVLLALCSSCEGLIKLPENMIIPAVFAYGDSIVDQGNNNGLRTTAIKCTNPPYGKDFPGGVPTGRFSNGKTPPDLIAEELGIANLIPAYLDPNLKAEDLSTGVSFASGGSGFDPETSRSLGVFSITTQLDYFREYQGKLKAVVGEERTNFILNNSLHFVVAGIDDITFTYFTALLRRVQYSISFYTDFVAGFASSFVEDLYNLGARRIVVLGVSPIGCLPFRRTVAGGLVRSCAENYNDAAKMFNVKLVQKLDSLSQRLPQSRIVYYDSYTILDDIIQHPQNYGFVNSDKGCCGTGNTEMGGLCNNLVGTCPDDKKYVFWDSYHPTEEGYRWFVNQTLPKYINNLM